MKLCRSFRCKGCVGDCPYAYEIDDRLVPAAEAIHYPMCWDTTAYPTVESALAEVAASFRCTNEDTHATGSTS